MHAAADSRHMMVECMQQQLNGANMCVCVCVCVCGQPCQIALPFAVLTQLKSLNCPALRARFV